MYSELGGNVGKAYAVGVKSLETLSVLVCEVSARHYVYSFHFVLRAEGGRARPLFPYAKIL